MKAWLRWILVITQTVGGLLGIGSTLVYLNGTENLPFLAKVISLALLGLYAITTVAGVLLAINEHHTTVMRIAIWMQIPILSSPIFGWLFSAGFSLNLTWIGKELGVNFWLGSQWQVNILQNLPWGIGINLFALLMLVFMKGLGKIPVIAPAPVTEQINTILQENLKNTALVDRGIQLQVSPEGDARVVIGSQHYTSIDEVPDEEVKAQIKSAIEKWKKKPSLDKTASSNLPNAS